MSSITIIPGTPEATALGHMKLMSELALEIRSGMVMSRNYSPLALCKRLGFTGRTKVQALAWAVENLSTPELPKSAVEVLQSKGYTIVVEA